MSRPRDAREAGAHDMRSKRCAVYRARIIYERERNKQQRSRVGSTEKRASEMSTHALLLRACIRRRNGGKLLSYPSIPALVVRGLTT